MTNKTTEAQRNAAKVYYAKNKELIQAKARVKDRTVKLPREFVDKLDKLAVHEGVTLKQLIIAAFGNI